MNSVECAYPVPEDLALGLLYIGANTFAVALTFIGQVFLALPDDSAGLVLLIYLLRYFSFKLIDLSCQVLHLYLHLQFGLLA